MTQDGAAHARRVFLEIEVRRCREDLASAQTMLSVNRSKGPDFVHRALERLIAATQALEEHKAACAKRAGVPTKKPAGRPFRQVFSRQRQVNTDDEE